MKFVLAARILCQGIYNDKQKISLHQIFLKIITPKTPSPDYSQNSGFLMQLIVLK
jgi:hypothetical protein